MAAGNSKVLGETHDHLHAAGKPSHILAEQEAWMSLTHSDCIGEWLLGYCSATAR